MSSPDYPLPWPGNWRAFYIPAQEFKINGGGSADPSYPGLWTNSFTVDFGQSGLAWEHPTGGNPDKAWAEYDLLLPPYLKHQRDGALIDYAVSYEYWTSGGLGGVNGNVLVRFAMSGYQHGVVLGSVGRVYIDRLITSPAAMQCGIVSIQSGWVGTQPIPEGSALHLQICRFFTNGVDQDTYLGEWFLTCVTLHVRYY